MNLGTMRTELLARTSSELSSTRANQFLNAARAELDRMFLWPWRETTTSGAAPLTIADLGPIQSVVDSSSNPLGKVDRQTLVENYGDLTVTGSPSSYFVDWSSGSRIVRVYPASTATITVRYWKVTADLSVDADTPASPSEAHMLIVDLAVRRALRDVNNDNEAEAVESEVNRQIDALLFQYPPGQTDGPDAYVSFAGASSDG